MFNVVFLGVVAIFVLFACSGLTIVGTTQLSSLERGFLCVLHSKSVIFSSLQFIGASMGTIDLSIPPQSGECSAPPDFPESACCVVVEYLSGGTLRQHLYANRDNKLTYEEVVELALDLARG